ncbi:hypothetical protein EVAR_25475_1 [Eumeta japonica]|uniref:Uncharacterized protein n=1 Tax=Eumeta variegata TaxID=151549 RepID=A0A4C1VM19_EUMVA|nr:hypothetical protein EVAR_25475_1 [Eumeta japonica]
MPITTDSDEAPMPNYFLLGGSGQVQTAGTFEDSDFNLHRQWRQAIHLVTSRSSSYSIPKSKCISNHCAKIRWHIKKADYEVYRLPPRDNKIKNKRRSGEVNAVSGTALYGALKWGRKEGKQGKERRKRRSGGSQYHVASQHLDALS